MGSKSVRKKVLVKAPKPALQKKTTLKVESSKAKGSSETELQKLDSESTRLTEKLSNLNAKREDLWGTKGHDHPSVKKITRLTPEQEVARRFHASLHASFELAHFTE